MSTIRNTIFLMALLAVVAVVLGQSSQGGPHTSQGGQGRVKRQAEQVDIQGIGVTVNWTTCDPTITARYSCQDCNSRLICLPIGGKVISCPIVYAPYCVDGFCSSVPSAECA